MATCGEVIRHMQDAALLVFPSVQREGFPMTIVEAFATGLPGLTTSFESMIELVKDGYSGRHYRHSDPRDLANVLDQMLGDEAALRALGRQARAEYQGEIHPDSQLRAVDGHLRDSDRTCRMNRRGPYRRAASAGRGGVCERRRRSVTAAANSSAGQRPGIPASQQEWIAAVTDRVSARRKCRSESGAFSGISGLPIRATVRVGQQVHFTAHRVRQFPPPNSHCVVQVCARQVADSHVVKGVEPDRHAGIRQPSHVGADHRWLGRHRQQFAAAVRSPVNPRAHSRGLPASRALTLALAPCVPVRWRGCSLRERSTSRAGSPCRSRPDKKNVA